MATLRKTVNRMREPDEKWILCPICGAKTRLLGVVSFLSYTAAVVFAATGFHAALGIHLFSAIQARKTVC